MKTKEIKDAVERGEKVCWSSTAYDVIKSNGEWVISCNLNNHCIGLTWTDGTTLNGKESDFFIKEN